MRNVADTEEAVLTCPTHLTGSMVVGGKPLPEHLNTQVPALGWEKEMVESWVVWMALGVYPIVATMDPPGRSRTVEGVTV